ncbi:hypothetical protein L249_5576 [Ophiocordyceps polyrhachis-furcata BCC 54312]|uniref:Sulfatase N-terminal domain-containing protein n=1 Tax=Ophiocordyceps polyrhachis-furcata BCC 54312 TaxID=1330021 RepID=A0A367LGT4_9HYPO|nr:hypothetical protein L249_5576 [Ophiocordyceps polyrhachis-furcata BCC 54312]
MLMAIFVSPARFVGRRLLLLTSIARFADRRISLALAAAAILSAKLVHVYAHADALPAHALLFWGPSLFAQDTLLLLLLRLLLDGRLPVPARPVASAVASAVAVLVTLLAGISISFFTVAGLELHWRNLGAAADVSAWRMLLTGLLSMCLVLVALVFLAGLLQAPCFLVTGMALDLLRWPIRFFASRSTSDSGSGSSDSDYRRLSQQQHDYDNSEKEADSDSDSELGLRASQELRPTSRRLLAVLYVLVGLWLLVQAVNYALRPSDSALVFMSWTLPLLPLVELTLSSHALSRLRGKDASGLNSNMTALGDPPSLPWLRSKKPLQGFTDWYLPDQLHYNADQDPIRVSNLDQPPLKELRSALGQLQIRNVVLLKLEATRKDVFPLKRDGFIWRRLANGSVTGELSDAAEDRLASLTPVANFLTGDYADGFEHKKKPRRGGVNFNNAHTSSTYTLKSLTASLCGLTPLIIDFNLEYLSHFYQPCLPHIFQALNQLGEDTRNDTAVDDDGSADFRSYPWRSTYMQSVTNTFDRQSPLMPTFGYKPGTVITKEYLRSSAAKFGRTNVSDINYFGLPETVLDDYVRDAFAEARRNKERLFLTHLTSTTHHDFKLPVGETYVPLTDDSELDSLSRYINVVGYVDRWVGRVLDIIREEGAEDDTLVVVAGDHGLSIAEQGSVSTYGNGNIGNFGVPLVLSHPKLPSIDVDDAVSSIQILPTILDLLIESGSLSSSQAEAARDLVGNYEGKSLIRPQNAGSGPKGLGDWQFSLINPGGTMLAVRERSRPGWRLIVPIIDNVSWRFTDADASPHEEESVVVAFDLDIFLSDVESKHGREASKWVRKAAEVTSWYVDENAKRWRFGGQRPKKPRPNP